MSFFHLTDKAAWQKKENDCLNGVAGEPLLLGCNFESLLAIENKRKTICGDSNPEFIVLEALTLSPKASCDVIASSSDET